MLGKWTCQYPVTPLRYDTGERLVTRGEVMPWTLAVIGPIYQVGGAKSDPFDTLALEMPYRSKELFHYRKCVGLELYSVLGLTRRDASCRDTGRSALEVPVSIFSAYGKVAERRLQNGAC